MASRGRPTPAPRKRPNEAFLANLTSPPALKKAKAADPVLSGQQVQEQEEAVPEQPQRQLSVAPSPAESAADTGNGSVSGVVEKAPTPPAKESQSAPPPAEAGGGEAQTQPSAVPPQPVAAEPATNQSEPAEAPATDQQAAGEGSAPEPPARPRKVKVTIMMVEDEVERLRSAFVHLPYEARAGSLSQWASRAIMTQVRSAEEEYNDGQPWPPISKGDVPVGRPVGS